MRLLGRNGSRDMLCLCLFECVTGFLMFFAVLAGPASAGRVPVPGITDAAVANHAFLLAGTMGLVSLSLGVYRPQAYLKPGGLLWRATVSLALTLPAIWVVATLARIEMPGFFDRAPLLPAQVCAAGAAVLLAARLTYAAALRRGLLVRRVVVVGQGGAAGRLKAAIDGLHRGVFDVVAASGLDDPGLEIAARRAWGVVLAEDDGPALEGRRGLACGRVLTASAFWEQQLGRVDLSGTELGCPGEVRREGRLGGVARRALDIGVAASLLVMTLPLMVLTALAVRLTSRGPAIYRQERVGLGGAPFTVMKFRSMHLEAERSGPAWATVQDPRVTWVGAILRKTRIDELPQLLNVLRGDMSMVGPRPERPYFVEQLKHFVPHYEMRCAVRPGLTGWAQVNMPYCSTIDDTRIKLSYDLYYVRNRDLLMDLGILLATVRVILFQEGGR